jgi:hypothetical protein
MERKLQICIWKKFYGIVLEIAKNILQEIHVFPGKYYYVHFAVQSGLKESLILMRNLRSFRPVHFNKKREERGKPLDEGKVFVEVLEDSSKKVFPTMTPPYSFVVRPINTLVFCLGKTKSI